MKVRNTKKVNLSLKKHFLENINLLEDRRSKKNSNQEMSIIPTLRCLNHQIKDSLVTQAAVDRELSALQPSTL